MSIKYLLKDFKLPKEISLRSEVEENVGVFEIEPFERGFATTIGNLFRRVLLSSLQGFVVTAIRINTGKKFLTSEYESISGVLQDSIDIVENIKNIQFLVDKDHEDPLRKLVKGRFKGAGKCTAEIFNHSDISILNKDIILFEATDEVDIDIELEIELGRGYVPSEVTEKRIEEEGTISIDAVFSPVDTVKYFIEGIRIGHRSDYEKLILSVKTNGTISPVDAVAEAAKIVKEHMTLFINFNEDEVEMVSEDENKLIEMRKLLELSIDELELSSRSYNCLKAANIVNIYELVRLTDKNIQALPNFGNKSMEEIQSKLAELNFSLGMTLPPEILN